MNQYFYYEGNTQKGPVSLEELLTKITPETDVWTQGMVDWAKAKDVPEVAAALNQASQPMGQTAQTETQVITVQTQNTNQNAGQNYSQAPDFKTLLVWAIVSTFLCCNVTGVVGIVMNLKAEIEWVKGNQEAAWQKYRTAITWIIVGAVAMVVFYILYFAVLQSAVNNNLLNF